MSKAQTKPIPIIIEHPSLDDTLFEGNPVLRGVISQSSLESLRIDNAYQREFLSTNVRRYLIEALSSGGRLPDMELGNKGRESDLTRRNVEQIIAEHRSIGMKETRKRTKKAQREQLR